MKQEPRACMIWNLQDMKHDVLFYVCIKFDLVQDDDDDEHDVMFLYYVWWCVSVLMHILPIMWCTMQDDEPVFLF